MSGRGLHISYSSALLLPPLPVIDLARIFLSYISGPDGTNIRQRRRAQNRASQRAFRERQIRHTKDLEAKLNKLIELHHDLRDAYQQKADEVDTLCAHVEELNKEINTLQMSVGCVSDPNGDGNGGVVKFENENPFEWNVDHSEPGMAFDWFSIFTDFTPAMNAAGEML